MVVMRLPCKLQKLIIIVTNENMTEPIPYFSMILGLTGMYVLILSFEGDDDDGKDDCKRDIYNFEYFKIGK